MPRQFLEMSDESPLTRSFQLYFQTFLSFFSLLMVGCGCGGDGPFIYLFIYYVSLIVMMMKIIIALMIRLIFPFINFTRQPQSGPPPALPPPSTLNQPDWFYLSFLTVPTEQSPDCLTFLSLCLPLPLPPFFSLLPFSQFPAVYSTVPL